MKSGGISPRLRRAWREARWKGLIPLLAVMAVATVLLVRYTHSAESPGGDSSPEHRPVVVVIGDSFTSGSDMNAGPTWAERLGAKQHWNLHRDGESGTGFLNDGPTRSFQKRLPDVIKKYASPDMVIVAGGHNDIARFPPAQIDRAAGEVLDQLHDAWPDARVELLSPLVSGTPTEASLAQTARFREVATRHHADFIDVSRFLDGVPGGIGSDGIHPTDNGHSILARKIAASLPAI